MTIDQLQPQEPNLWIRLSTGKYIDLNNFTVDDVDLYDIEISLNNLTRFNGHHRDNPPLTVAQHTLLTYIIAKEWLGATPADLLDCILHDFPEAYYGDITSPVKRGLGIDNLPFIKKIDDSVYNALHPQGVIPKTLVRGKADLLSLDIERRSMWNSQLGLNYWPLPPAESEKHSLAEKKALFYLVSSIPYVEIQDLYDSAIRSYKEIHNPAFSHKEAEKGQVINFTP